MTHHRSPSRWWRMPECPVRPMHWTGDLALALQARVESLSRARGCVVYVFARGASVYVLSEDHPLAHRWAVKRTHEWVGCYAGRPDVDVLRADLAATAELQSACPDVR